MSVAAERIRRESNDLQRRLEELQRRQSQKRVSATRLQIDLSPSGKQNATLLSPPKGAGSGTDVVEFPVTIGRPTSPLAATDALASAQSAQLSDINDVRGAPAPVSIYNAHAQRDEGGAGSAAPLSCRDSD